ncbi:MAG TPA: DNA-binding response regulator, partial [Lachnospiraceae bacterium]|nr:DNA-binding response regulator [Lachnospiraceae bacterium]HAP72626.1 DNA-binding response regulator [Lachnospiraceae bacterium]HBH69873.1 DNA-binding response regulator [Lachnospiraceae bacterium]
MSRILVCDDDHDIVKAICIYLKGSGYDTVTAFNGKEAVEKLETDKPDLVILDVMMPVMDGIEA